MLPTISTILAEARSKIVNVARILLSHMDSLIQRKKLTIHVGHIYQNKFVSYRNTNKETCRFCLLTDGSTSANDIVDMIIKRKFPTANDAKFIILLKYE